MKETIGIVIVDDNDIDLMISERLISVIDPSINIATFGCGENFISWIRDENHQCIAKKVVILVDIYMPKMNGFEVVDNALKILESKGCAVDCYLVSATIDEDDLFKIRKHPQVKGFIGKPITQEVIHQLVGSFSHA